ncbi:phosphoserine phosphatase SerB [Shewanella eurypsychrophilus]|uniref:Phosphoserine phosphatase n=1 Tax=Shewanella eurypsychrophilus TaxID=2593656 RepID=A0ABX6V904_9GAMM|nr:MULTISPECIES: phosphoserine phosphatase SerB [Shewanella]QFU23942.1 phosphoserine phosphatase SerB [Shewanella sp. YLB-09]QPG59158.1 phosphoserine phosphatase SerB [Shewanella eurypsychrophilus]
MESLSHTLLFSWLSNGENSRFQYQSKTLSKHHETLAPDCVSRLRCVYEDKVQEAELSAAIGRLELDLSLAIIERDSGLYCVELCADVPFSLTQLQVISSVSGVETFSISNTQAKLNEPGLLVMDMDSTAIEIECIDELAVMAGVGEAVAEVTERAMQGELDFEESLRARVAKLQGADASIIQTLCDKLPLMPGLIESVNELQKHGWRLVVASGGFTPFVGHLKQLLGLDAAFANELVVENGKLKGTVTGQVVDAQFKADTVLRCAKEWNIPDGQRLAIGDGANDIPMIEVADYGIAYHAKPKLEQAADVVISKLNLKVLPFLLLLS